MNSDYEHIFEGNYTEGKPFIRARIAIINTETGRQETIDTRFWIDTGFGGGIHVAETFRSEANLAGVTLTQGTVELAGGIRRLAYFCLARIQQIEDYDLPAPGIETPLILQGSSNYGLLGLDVLKHFIAKFNGPNQLLTIMSAPHT